MVTTDLKEPKLITQFLSDDDFKLIKNHVINIDKSTTRFYDGYNRYEWTSTPELNYLHQKLTVTAREHFKSDTLVPSFNFASWYFGDASLEHHVDINACTYSIDLSVYATLDWDLYVEGVPYALKENDALLYYGETQEHWREPLVNPNNDVVCNAFFFYVEPDHWYITEPMEKHEAIRTEKAIGTVQDLAKKARTNNGN